MATIESYRLFLDAGERDKVDQTQLMTISSGRKGQGYAIKTRISERNEPGEAHFSKACAYQANRIARSLGASAASSKGGKSSSLLEPAPHTGKVLGT